MVVGWLVSVLHKESQLFVDKMNEPLARTRPLHLARVERTAAEDVACRYNVSFSENADPQLGSVNAPSVSPVSVCARSAIRNTTSSTSFLYPFYVPFLAVPVIYFCFFAGGFCSRRRSRKKSWLVDVESFG